MSHAGRSNACDANYMVDDQHVTDTFVWRKKLEKETNKKDMSESEIKKMKKRIQAENKLELEKVKKRRLEREVQREERDKEQEMVQRDKESGFYKVWLNQEEHFHLSQAKLRSKIRIENGRPKPIDMLVHYISSEDDSFAIDKPYKYLNGLTLNDLEDLLEDIKIIGKLEQGENFSYWRDLTIVAEGELDKLRKFDSGSSSSTRVGERRSVVNSSVSDAIVQVYKGKPLADLLLLRKRIEEKLKGIEVIDVGYWETLQNQLNVYIARKQLAARHKQELQRKLFRLKQEQGIESAQLFPISQNTSGTSKASTSASASSSKDPNTDHSFKVPESVSDPSMIDIGDEDMADEDTNLDPCREEYDRFGYSPELLQPADLPPGTIVCDEDTDVKNLEYARCQVRLTGQAQADEEEDLIRQAQQGMNADECQFSVETPLKQALPVWSDKYRPRKPRFFNRVHTGFEWNKYNQTHYDIDNPPPKVVQGYKFNIFYPDLIDKSKIAEYCVEPCKDNPEFSILRFKAGAPYEDIGFKVVNKEWECSNRHGFRCQFYNNIFQLWFKFKRYRYRR